MDLIIEHRLSIIDHQIIIIVQKPCRKKLLWIMHGAEEMAGSGWRGGVRRCSQNEELS
jgi:hypothetical protein